jgi:O-antigen ligase
MLLKTFRYSFVLLAISAILARNTHVPGLDLETGIRPLSMTATLIGCVFLTQLPERKLYALAGWSACVLLNFLTGARTSTVMMIFLLVVNPMVKGIRTRVLLSIAMAAVGIGIFYTPQFQTRFFVSGSGSLLDVFRGEVSGTGRFDVWPLILERAWHHPVLGEGIGTAYDFVPTVWEEVNQCHNDYLRTFFEFGFVGLTLFVFVLAWQTVCLFHETHRSLGATRRAFAAAFLGMLAFLISACTDNPLGYNIWFTNPLFALMGAAYGASENGPLRRAGNARDSA